MVLLRYLNINIYLFQSKYHFLKYYNTLDLIVNI